MSLLSEIDEIENRATACAVGRWAQLLTGDEAADLAEALASDYPLTVVYRALTKHKRLGFSPDLFQRHYVAERGGRRRCSCRS